MRLAGNTYRYWFAGPAVEPDNGSAAGTTLTPIGPKPRETGNAAWRRRTDRQTGNVVGNAGDARARRPSDGRAARRALRRHPARADRGQDGHREGSSRVQPTSSSSSPRRAAPRRASNVAPDAHTGHEHLPLLPQRRLRGRRRRAGHGPAGAWTDSGGPSTAMVAVVEVLRARDADANLPLHAVPDRDIGRRRRRANGDRDADPHYIDVTFSPIAPGRWTTPRSWTRGPSSAAVAARSQRRPGRTLGQPGADRARGRPAERRAHRAAGA